MSVRFLHQHLAAIRSYFSIRNEESDVKIPNLDPSHTEYPEIVQYIIWSYKQKHHERHTHVLPSVR